MNTLALRLIHAAHMCLPLSWALWHVERLRPDTALRLLRLFG